MLIIYLCTARTLKSGTTLKMETTRSSIVRTWKSVMRSSIRKTLSWNTENVTVYDSEINGEYLGWHSKNLRLVNCKISGTQPLCYAHDLMMENCTMADDCDLAFEYSSVQATINSSIRSVKNPRTGSITAESYGEVILDENIKAPGNCQLRLWNERTCFSA